MNTDIIATVTANPVTVLTDEKTYSEFYQRIKEELDAHQPDITTAKGRGEIASLAYKVTRTKTAIDAAGKKLNEDARAKINAVDAQRRKIREELDLLAETVRKPLTDWETAEKEREDIANSQLSHIIELSRPGFDEPSDEIKARLADLMAMHLDPEIHLDNYDDNREKLEAAIASMNAEYNRALKAEADAAELARLRAEQEARDQAEAEAKRAEEQAERDRIAREKAEAEYKANVEREAERARLAEAEKARIERERIEREAAAKIAAAEAEARAVKEKAEREERERQEAIERTRREEAARQADREHRGKIMRDAKEAIMEHGPDEDTAKKIVLAIVAGEIPNTRIIF